MLLSQGVAQAQTPQALPQTQNVNAPKAVASAVKPVASTTSKPAWSELSPAQQQSLHPLAASWSGISEAQKRKWLEVSKGYATLPPADQAVMHSRMVEWVAMSPQQRATARLNFAKTKELSNQLTSDEKKAKWQTYQSLSPEEKAKLAANATPKPTGAATAIKPVAPQKLAVTPKNSSPALAAPAAPISPSAATTAKTADTPQNVATPAAAK